MARKDNSKLRELIKEYGVKDMKDVHEFVKMLTAETIQAALDAELESELGYSKYDTRNKKTENSRNGYSSKTVQGSMGEVEIGIPRDRKGEYEPGVCQPTCRVTGVKVSRALSSFSGLSHTTVSSSRFLTGRVFHRSGVFRLASSNTCFLASRIAADSPRCRCPGVTYFKAL